MTNSKWKSNLLKSSLPLEYEVARDLVSAGFAVYPDYKYRRADSGVLKEFSVDIEAMAFTPFSNPNKIESVVQLLIECKHRFPPVKWLFVPEPNTPDFAVAGPGHTLRCIDGFSRVMLNRNGTSGFDHDLAFCFKGTEVNTDGGEVHSAELQHGVAQLQFALPRLVSQGIAWGDPVFFCPVLLTNAELFVCRKTMSGVDVEAADLLDFSRKVPYLVLYVDYGPEFEEHCKAECQSLLSLTRSKEIKELNEYRKRAGGKVHLPLEMARSFARGERSYLVSYFTQFVVCHRPHFKALLRQLKKVISRAMRQPAKKLN